MEKANKDCILGYRIRFQRHFYSRKSFEFTKKNLLRKNASLPGWCFLRESCGDHVGIMWGSCGDHVGITWESCGNQARRITMGAPTGVPMREIPREYKVPMEIPRA